MLTDPNSEDACSVRKAMRAKLEEFEAKNSNHDASYTVYSDNSGKISDIWGNEESFEDLIEYIFR